MKSGPIIRQAVPEDMQGWLQVARDVKHIMRHPAMDTDPEFLDYAARKLAQEDAVCAFDPSAGRYAGFVGFSRHFNRITWVGVAEAYRRQGLGRALLAAALAQLDAAQPITVDTYREDYPPGLPARRLYLSMGFTETDAALHNSMGHEIARLTLLN